MQIQPTAGCRAAHTHRVWISAFGRQTWLNNWPVLCQPCRFVKLFARKLCRLIMQATMLCTADVVAVSGSYCAHGSSGGYGHDNWHCLSTLVPETCPERHSICALCMSTPFATLSEQCWHGLQGGFYQMQHAWHTQ